MRPSVLAFLALLTSSLALAPAAAHAQQAGKVYHSGHAAAVDFDQVEQVELRQWSAFVLICNLKTAKALSVTIPRSILLLADRVME